MGYFLHHRNFRFSRLEPKPKFVGSYFWKELISSCFLRTKFLKEPKNRTDRSVLTKCTALLLRADDTVTRAAGSAAGPDQSHRGGRRTYEACLLHGCSIIRDELLPRLPTGTISGDEFEDDDDAVGGRW